MEQSNRSITTFHSINQHFLYPFQMEKGLHRKETLYSSIDIYLVPMHINHVELMSGMERQRKTMPIMWDTYKRDSLLNIDLR